MSSISTLKGGEEEKERRGEEGYGMVWYGIVWKVAGGRRQVAGMVAMVAMVME